MTASDAQIVEAVNKIVVALRKQRLKRKRKRRKSRRAAIRAAELEAEHGLGAVVARKIRATAAVRVLYRPGTQAHVDEKWLLVCVPHASVLSSDTRRLGAASLSDPDWCEDCQALVATTEGQETP